MELIASSRIVKAQKKARAAMPYTIELTRAVSMLASAVELEHPLLKETWPAKRSAVLIITSDRGLAGAYSANAIKMGEQVRTHLEDEVGHEVDLYIAGSKGVAYYDFREREIKQSWTGFSESPSVRDAREITDALLEAFLTPTEEGGVDEIHVVSTVFESMIKQTPRAIRLLPLMVVDDPNEDPEKDPAESMSDEDRNWDPSDREDDLIYDFEPDAKTVLDTLLPLFIGDRIHTALLQASASELASRQQAMKSATDNAKTLIEQLTREANQARQAEITQEITEIVGGASALAESA